MLYEVITVKTALVNAILGKPEDFDAAWASMRETLTDMGIEEANQAMTKLISYNFV